MSRRQSSLRSLSQASQRSLSGIDTEVVVTEEEDDDDDNDDNNNNNNNNNINNRDKQQQQQKHAFSTKSKEDIQDRSNNIATFMIRNSVGASDKKHGRKRNNATAKMFAKSHSQLSTSLSHSAPALSTTSKTSSSSPSSPLSSLVSSPSSFVLSPSSFASSPASLVSYSSSVTNEGSESTICSDEDKVSSDTTEAHKSNSTWSTKWSKIKNKKVRKIRKNSFCKQSNLVCCKQPSTHHVAQKMFKALDVDMDLRISWIEFCMFMKYSFEFYHALVSKDRRKQETFKQDFNREPLEKFRWSMLMAVMEKDSIANIIILGDTVVHVCLEGEGIVMRYECVFSSWWQ